ncbi:hypothetical protein BDN72DRAFT_831129 [Pluteus cervinus]|uniref:Uncharacterized protein n=1 Tax=Pluteus cervinus TaxID=181527 RepID=A0ACD3BG48_9AGAR|nr:hypothetical protein BDN72DRAFT_831129 [Pluteus cervinus]
MSERDAPNANDVQGTSAGRMKVATILDSHTFHKAIISLTFVDVFCTLFGLIYLVLSSNCEPESEWPWWLEALDRVSLGITSIFLAEIPFSLWAFGWKTYNPFGDHPYAGLHLFDAFIVISTFALEVGLKGAESEVAALLIMFRLWRFVRLLGGIAVGAGDLEEGRSRDLEEEIEQLKSKLDNLQSENSELRRRITEVQS